MSGLSESQTHGTESSGQVHNYIDITTGEVPKRLALQAGFPAYYGQKDIIYTEVF